MMLASIFAQPNYYFEKISSGIFEPSDNHVAMAKIGISSFLRAADLFQSALEGRNLFDSNVETAIEDLRYALRHLESALSAKVQLSAQQERITLYAIRYLLDEVISFAESADRDS